MTRIQKAFVDRNAFIGYITAGDPNLEATKEYVLHMEKAGAALVELGIPFSDPIADGPVIQAASVRALKAGCTTDKVFDTVAQIRKESQIPLVFLAYCNTLYKYGYEAFFTKCEQTGVDGIIIPDIPYEEKGEILPFARKHGVDIITMVAPTSKERIQMITKDATGFIYLVSSMGVTGTRENINTDISSMVNSIREVSDIPVAVGFGINTAKQVKEFLSVADGAIVGSALVKCIEEHKEQAGPYLETYIKELMA